MATRIKEKAAARQQNKDNRARATVKNVRISSRKVKIVIDLIRGKQVDQDRLCVLDQYCPPPFCSDQISVYTASIRFAT